MEIHEGRRLILKCKVQGETNPQIKWFKDNKSINMPLHPNIKITSSTKHSELRIEHVITNDTGNYSCRGESQQNQISKWVFVSVYSACPVNICNMGTCFIINNNSLCRCPETHTGEFCDQPVSNDKITNKLIMNTQPIKKNLNYLQSDSKSSPSVDLINSVSVLNDNNQQSKQNMQLLSEIKREKFDLCTLPEFQFTTDCLHVKSHLTTFIGTAITCSMIILLLTFCAAYFRRRKLLNKRKQDCRCLSKDNKSEPVNSNKSADHRSSSVMKDSTNIFSNDEVNHSFNPFKSISFEGTLYTDSINKNFRNYNVDILQSSITNSNHGFMTQGSNNSDIQISSNGNDNLTYNCSKKFPNSSSSCSNTAYVVWTTTPEIIRDDERELNNNSLDKILIHTNAQQQQQQPNSKEQQLLFSPTTSYISATLPNSFRSQEIILNNDALFNQNDLNALLSSTTSSSTVISGPNLYNPVNVELADISNKMEPLSDVSVLNPMEAATKSNFIVSKSQKPKETVQSYTFCTNMAYCDSITNSQISNISTLITDNSLQQFTTLDTVLQPVDANESFLKHVYCTSDTFMPQSSSTTNTCIIVDQDNLKFGSKLVYFCPNTYPENS
ncbi:unnamed protein product [Schistosoma rodhaini]|uniref:Ig-like domain-containing protein n=2 Tax=Schistosoma rodhaini TaxID=6188 RepID=A0AA85G6Y2_9TREM|nr:unnamed protein product [Schistosoma rodhaini]